MAAAPSAAAVGFICQPRSHSSRMWRLVALSSTTSTGRSRNCAADRASIGVEWCGCRPNRAVNDEGAASSRRRSPRDLAAHQGHQPRGDRQAQARAAVLPRGRGVGLLEGAEDLLLLVARDADAGVADREAAGRPRPRRRFAVGLDAHDHLAPVGELDRVADQVDQHLAQPARVADQGVGHVRLDVPGQLQPLAVGPQGQGPQGVAQRVRKREVGRVQLQLAGLDLGEVEDVVDDGQQGLGRRLDHVQVLPLVLGQRRVEDQVGHAEDAVHGRADLMAHVGQELALGPVGRLRRLPGQARLLLQPPAVRDVLEDRDGIGGLARCIALERH